MWTEEKQITWLKLWITRYQKDPSYTTKQQYERWCVSLARLEFNHRMTIKTAICQKTVKAQYVS